MIRIYYKQQQDPHLNQISHVKEGCWIHADEASLADTEELANILALPAHALVDSVDRYEVPRLEKIEQALVFFTRYPSDQEVGLYTSTLTLIVTKHHFVTISPHRCSLVETFLKSYPHFSTLDRSKLLVDFLTKINQEFTSHIKKVRHEVLSAEKEMIFVESDDITALTKYEEILNQYLSSLLTTRTALETLKSPIFEDIYQTQQTLIENSINSTKQSEELCAIVIKSIRSLRDAYQIIFTNNLHKTIKLLTALTIILSIPTMIASVYGMNVGLPLAHSRFAFIFVVSFTIITSLFGLWIFKKKGWL